jgi:hypothetical protein
VSAGIDVSHATQTLDAAVTDVQAVVAGFIPSERSLVDELIAERRAEAASE